MPRLFISYRRADSRKDAGRLYDRLAQAFGTDNVFKDVDDIPPGSDFRGVIAEAVGQCDVLLALIGRQWLTVKNEQGQRRLDNPGDFVRIEIETGLGRAACTVIPVLVDGASMPGSNDLPESLRDLTFRNAIIVRDDPDFHHDVNRLVDSLKRQFGASSPAKTPAFDAHAALQRFYEASDAKLWDAARALLAELRESGQAPRFFDLEGAEQSIWAAIEREEAAKEYAILKLMAERESPDRVWAALQVFWESHAGYDPDGIADEVRPRIEMDDSVRPIGDVDTTPVPALDEIEAWLEEVEPEPPRVRPGPDILPGPFEWITIPAGRVEIENHGWFEVAEFEIAKYPITNAQFQVFADAEDGYRDAEWWAYSETARAWRAKNKLEDAGYAGDNLPRTNVNWYEAVAFCRWLSAQISENIMLPTEQQWQRAAQGDDGRVYPWGNEEPTKVLCNISEWIGQPTPVTQYPKGASPYGVMDMAGNVWEWCLNEHDNPRKSDLESFPRRVLRSSAWGFGQASAQVMYRDYFRPRLRSVDGGFRVVCARSPSRLR